MLPHTAAASSFPHFAVIVICQPAREPTEAYFISPRLSRYEGASGRWPCGWRKEMDSRHVRQTAKTRTTDQSCGCGFSRPSAGLGAAVTWDQSNLFALPPAHLVVGSRAKRMGGGGGGGIGIHQYRSLSCPFFCLPCSLVAHPHLRLEIETLFQLHFL